MLHVRSEAQEGKSELWGGDEMKKRKSFDEELWHLFQDMIGAGKELVKSIETADYKKMREFNSPTEHMKTAIQGWKHFENSHKDWRKNPKPIPKRHT